MTDERVTTSLDYEGARALSQRIFEIYDKDKSGYIESYEIKAMLVDTYKSINKVETHFDIQNQFWLFLYNSFED